MRRENRLNGHHGAVCKNPKTSINWSLGFLIIKQSKKLYYNRPNDENILLLAETSETWKNCFKENENLKEGKLLN